MTPQMGEYTKQDADADIAAEAAIRAAADAAEVIARNLAITTHTADADAHHPEEIPDGRALGGGVTYLSLPGYDGSGGITTFGPAANQIYYFPIYVRTPITVDQVTIEVTVAAAAGNKCRVAIYGADVNWQPTARQVASGEIAIDAIAVVNTAIAATVLREGRYLIALTVQASPTLRALRYGMTIGLNPVFGTSPHLGKLQVAAAYAALPDPGTPWDTPTLTVEPILQPVLLRVSVP